MIQAMASLAGQMASIAGSVQAGQAHLLRLNAQIGQQQQQQQQQQLQLPGYPMSPFGGLSFPSHLFGGANCQPGFGFHSGGGGGLDFGLGNVMAQPQMQHAVASTCATSSSGREETGANMKKKKSKKDKKKDKKKKKKGARTSR